MNKSSKPNLTNNRDPEPIEVATGEIPAGNPASNEEIRRRAYEIHLDRGGQSGGELDDWLEAKRELARAALWRTQPRLRKEVI
jgi:hypothetical protein